MAQVVPLITGDDVFEQIRDAIPTILATEGAAQQVLAVAQFLDPTPWQYRVFSERINPWEAFRDGEVGQQPIINVWYDSSTFDKSSSNARTRQTAKPSRYNIDVYAYAITTQDVTGQISGDEEAAKNCHHVVKLVRSILMHDKYKYLGLQGKVGNRWISNITAYQPKSGDQPITQVAAARLILEVDHNEIIELTEHEILDVISIEMRHEPGGQIIAELLYEDLTPA